jgi:RNA polymerase sigma-70 factor, ECF subfamily
MPLASCDAERVTAVEEMGSPGASLLRDALEHAEPFLYSLARRLCRDDSEARDLVQDTFVHALRSGRPTPTNPRSYLAVILKNLFVDRCRALVGRPDVVRLDEDHDVASGEPEARPPWERVSVADVHAALTEIDPEFRRVYELHVFEQRSYEEIAHTLGIQRLTVGTRLTRTRQRLRVLLCRMLGEEPTK